MDARELIQTESTYLESKVNWELTEKIIQEIIYENYLRLTPSNGVVILD